jgi:hypothetical protein
MWINLSEDGCGIQGTPFPGRVSKSESHGCVRLTNWDAERVAERVSKGTPVTFVDDPKQNSYPASVEHSGQASPIESNTSRTAAIAASRDRPCGGSCRAVSIAGSRACGSVRSFIQPCSSHSRMAPASRRTEIAHPSIVQTVGRRSFTTSIENCSSAGGRIPEAVPRSARLAQTTDSELWEVRARRRLAA